MTRSTRARARRERSGFTMIELMIVVAIISFIAVVLVPLLLRGYQRITQDDAVAEIDARASGVERAALPEPPPSVLPSVESARVSIDLETHHRLRGMEVFTLYDARLSGEFELRNDFGDALPVRLEFSFPAETTEATGVSLAFLRGDQDWVEPEGVVYHRGGIRWIGPLPPGELLRARVSYAAQGRDLFRYALPGVGRARSVEIELSAPGVDADMVARDSLQPTATRAGSLSWSYQDLVAERPLILQLPGATSPLGRVMLLCKLVGLAVLLFGAGFWYLSKGYRPGQLDDFRWGHFLLLATTYSLFFVVFAVLSFHASEALWRNLLLAAGVSLPMLMLHVSRVTSLRFALSRVLPLTVFTLGVVVNGVYGGEVRDYLFLAGAVLTLGLVTVTYRGWLEGLRRHEQEVEAKQKRKQRDDDLEARLDRQAELLDAAQEVDDRAEQRLAREIAGEGQRRRAAISGARERLAGLRREHRSQRSEAGSAARLADDEAHRAACKRLRRELERSTGELERCLAGLEGQLTSLKLKRQQLQEERRARREEVRDALAAFGRLCDQAALALEELDAPPRGAGPEPGGSDDETLVAMRRRSEQLRHEIVAATGHTEKLRQRLDALDMEQEPETHGAAAFVLSQRVERLARGLGSALDELSEVQEAASKRLRELQSRALEGRDRDHCAACGVASPPSSHCPACGAPRPQRLTCRSCGDSLLLPLHLVGKKERHRQLCCLSCGSVHERAA